MFGNNKWKIIEIKKIHIIDCIRRFNESAGESIDQEQCVVVMYHVFYSYTPQLLIVYKNILKWLVRFVSRKIQICEVENLNRPWPR